MKLDGDVIKKVNPPNILNYESQIRLPCNLGKQEVVRVVWIDLRNMRITQR